MNNPDLSLLKHSAAIHMACSLTANERKVYNRMLHEARPDMERGAVHEVDIAVLETAIAGKSNNRPHFRNLIEGLLQKPVRYNIFDKDKLSQEVWRMNSWLLAEVGFNEDKTRCRYSFPNTLIELLKNPSLYARIDLSIQSNMSTTHGLPLYEFFVDLLGARRNTVNYVFPIESIRELLDIKKDSYTDFKIFNRDVLNKAFKDINENADIIIEATCLNYIFDTNNRRQKRVASINLLIRRKHFIDEDILAIPVCPAQQGSTSIREYLMHIFENKETIVNEILTKYSDENYIRHNIHYAEQRHLAGKVDKLQAYARASLEKNYVKYKPGTVVSMATGKTAATPTRAEMNEEKMRTAESQRFQEAKEKLKLLNDDALEAVHTSYEASDAFHKLDNRFKRRESRIYQSNLINFFMNTQAKLTH